MSMYKYVYLHTHLKRYEDPNNVRKVVCYQKLLNYLKNVNAFFVLLGLLVIPEKILNVFVQNGRNY